MIIEYQIWSWEDICLSIPNIPFSHTHSIPATPICSQTLKKKPVGEMNTSQSRCLPQTSGLICLSHLSLTDRKQILKRIQWQFFFFSVLNTVVELLLRMCCQLNSESCFNSSQKPHKEFFEKSQNLFTPKPGDRENLSTPFTCKELPRTAETGTTPQESRWDTSREEWEIQGAQWRGISEVSREVFPQQGNALPYQGTAASKDQTKEIRNAGKG